MFLRKGISPDCPVCCGDFGCCYCNQPPICVNMVPQNGEEIENFDIGPPNGYDIPSENEGGIEEVPQIAATPLQKESSLCKKDNYFVNQEYCMKCYPAKIPLIGRKEKKTLKKNFSFYLSGSTRMLDETEPEEEEESSFNMCREMDAKKKDNDNKKAVSETNLNQKPEEFDINVTGEEANLEKPKKSVSKRRKKSRKRRKKRRKSISEKNKSNNEKMSIRGQCPESFMISTHTSSNVFTNIAPFTRHSGINYVRSYESVTNGGDVEDNKSLINDKKKFSLVEGTTSNVKSPNFVTSKSSKSKKVNKTDELSNYNIDKNPSYNSKNQTSYNPSTKDNLVPEVPMIKLASNGYLDSKKYKEVYSEELEKIVKFSKMKECLEKSEDGNARRHKIFVNDENTIGLQNKGLTNNYSGTINCQNPKIGKFQELNDYVLLDLINREKINNFLNQDIVENKQVAYNCLVPLNDYGIKTEKINTDSEKKPTILSYKELKMLEKEAEMIKYVANDVKETSAPEKNVPKTQNKFFSKNVGSFDKNNHFFLAGMENISDKNRFDDVIYDKYAYDDAFYDVKTPEISLNSKSRKECRRLKTLGFGEKNEKLTKEYMKSLRGENEESGKMTSAMENRMNHFHNIRSIKVKKNDFVDIKAHFVKKQGPKSKFMKFIKKNVKKLKN